MAIRGDELSQRSIHVVLEMVQNDKPPYWSMLEVALLIHSCRGRSWKSKFYLHPATTPVALYVQTSGETKIWFLKLRLLVSIGKILDLVITLIYLESIRKVENLQRRYWPRYNLVMMVLG
jgi:hypothetical protein